MQTHLGGIPIRSFTSALIACGCLVFSLAQESHYRVEVRLVQVEARVLRNGEPVSGLGREDFRLFEDGREQEIAFLRYVAPPDQVPDSDPGGEAPEPADAKAGGAEGEDSTFVEPTWIYISPEVQSPVEVSRMVEGVRKFLRESFLPHFRISIGGIPFTDDRELLLATLDRIERSPFGHAPDLPASVNQEILHMGELEFERRLGKAQNAETEMIASMTGFEREPLFEGTMGAVPPFSVEGIDRKIIFFGRLAFFRYLDLAERMARLPGKKIVILFRAGLRLEVDNYDLMTRLLSVAQRYRVSFYTMDSRGLETVSPLEEGKVALPWDRGRREAFFQSKALSRHERMLQSREGLYALAEETGGRSLVDSNDLSRILTSVRNDSGGYYVLGYYPEKLEESGRFRKLKIEVEGKGRDVESPRGYFERKPLSNQSRTERLLSLRKSLDSETSPDFGMRAQIDVFADPEGKPQLVFSLGTRLAEFESDDKGTLEASILARVSDLFARKMPYYHEYRFEGRLKNGQVPDLAESLLHYNSEISVAPGRYRWESVVRDELSGRLATFRSAFSVPDFSAPSVPSSLLVTTIAQPATEETRGGLEAGGMRYFPQPVYRFKQGETIHLLFDLYNPTPQDLQESSQGMQLALLKNGQPVREIQAGGTPHASPDGDRIRFTAWIDSGNLDPSDYTVLAILPNYSKREIPHLEERFQIIP